MFVLLRIKRLWKKKTKNSKNGTYVSLKDKTIFFLFLWKPVGNIKDIE